jgi:hypothetical protein
MTTMTQPRQIYKRGYIVNQMLAQIIWRGCTIADVSCPTKYFTEASSINLRRSIQYGLGKGGTSPDFLMNEPTPDGFVEDPNAIMGFLPQKSR